MPKKTISPKRKRSSLATLKSAYLRGLEDAAMDKFDDIANVLDVALSRKQTDPRYGKVWNMVPCYILMDKLKLVDPTTLRQVKTNEYDERSGLVTALYMAEITKKGRDMHAQFTRGGYYSELKRKRT